MRNESARRLRQGPRRSSDRRAASPRPRAFGIVVEDLTNPYAADVARGAELTLNDAGHDALWLSSDHSAGKERRNLELLTEHRAAGVLVVPVGLDQEGIDRLRTASDMVVVLVDRAGPDVCSVQVDHVAGGDIAAAHLLARGRDRLAFVTAEGAPPPVEERGRGAARAVAEAGGGCELMTLTQRALSPTEGQAAAHRLLEMSPAPTGVFCANDLLAIGLINELLRRGVSVPDDIAVVGYDDIELASSSAVPLTTVRQPRFSVGEEAAELALAEWAEGESHLHRQVILTPELVERESA